MWSSIIGYVQVQQISPKEPIKQPLSMQAIPTIMQLAKLPKLKSNNKEIYSLYSSFFNQFHLSRIHFLYFLKDSFKFRIFRIHFAGYWFYIFSNIYCNVFAKFYYITTPIKSTGILQPVTICHIFSYRWLHIGFFRIIPDNNNCSYHNKCCYQARFRSKNSASNEWLWILLKGKQTGWFKPTHIKP